LLKTDRAKLAAVWEDLVIEVSRRVGVLLEIGEEEVGMEVAMMRAVEDMAAIAVTLIEGGEIVTAVTAALAQVVAATEDILQSGELPRHTGVTRHREPLRVTLRAPMRAMVALRLHTRPLLVTVADTRLQAEPVMRTVARMERRLIVHPRRRQGAMRHPPQLRADTTVNLPRLRQLHNAVEVDSTRISDLMSWPSSFKRDVSSC